MKKIIVIIFAFATSATYAQKVKMMSYNIRNGIGMDEKVDYNRVADVIKRCDADFVALQEIDSVTGRSKGVDVVKKIAELTNMNSSYSKAIDYDGGAYGVGMLSKEKPINISRLPLPGSEESRTILIAEFEDLIFSATHLSLTPQDQLRSLKILDSIAKNVEKPIILAGDFNFKPKSEQFKMLIKNFVVLSDVAKMTFPADKPKVCIDYIVLGKNGSYNVKVENSDVIDAPLESDHRPIMIEIVIEKVQK